MGSVAFSRGFKHPKDAFNDFLLCGSLRPERSPGRTAYRLRLNGELQIRFMYLTCDNAKQ